MKTKELKAAARRLSHADLLMIIAEETKEAIRDALSGLRIEFDGERSLTIAGTTVVLPVPIDRGVFREGATYTRGDVISHHGHLWIAQEATTARPPSAAWRLAVRKPADSRDAR